MFRANETQQITVYDSYLSLPAHIQRLIEKSWAKDFSDVIFPAIDEERFSVLYSDVGSRPNTPVNILVGSMLLKEYFGQTEEELLMSIYCDVLYQYALHLTQEEQPPVSDRSWSRFRERLLKYERETGIDLMKAEMESLAQILADHMQLKGNVKRMDSLMVASRCKRMSRLEILYAVSANAVRLLNRLGLLDYIPRSCVHYLDEEDHNNVIYRCRGDEAESRLERTIRETAELKQALETAELNRYGEYELLSRALREQTNEDADGVRTPKDKREIRSDSLQNPSDPDATFRRKAGEEYKGYVGNVVETLNDDGLGIITTMDFEKNIHSDSQFLKDYLEQRESSAQQETLIADGAYGGTENVRLAEESGVELVTTALTGKNPDEVMGEFQLSADGSKVLRCPMGYEPVKSSYHPKTGMCRAKFSRSCCENCPYRNKCRAREQKRSFVVNVSEKMVDRANTLKKLSTPRYRHLARLRNGIECRPSLLRRRLDVDNIPVLGYFASKCFFMVKTGASNLIAFFSYRKRQRMGCAIFS